MIKVFIVDQYHNPGLLRFTETKVFFDAKNQGLEWAYDCEVVDSIDDITEDCGIVINSGECITSTFRNKFQTATSLIDARGHADLITFSPHYDYLMRTRPPFDAGSKQLYIIENLYRVVLRSQKLVYLDNTEAYIPTVTDCKNFYGLASGWKSVQFVNDFGVKNFDNIVIYDVNPRQLEYQRYLHSQLQLPETVSQPHPVYGKYNPLEKIKKFWPQWHSTQVKFELINLFDPPKLLDNSFVWISNVFKYEPTIFELGWQKCKLAKKVLRSTNETCIISEI
jgi:hypothetical protein